MADIVTGTVTGLVDVSMLQMEHSDIRREAAEHTNEIVREGLKSADRLNSDIKQSGWDVFKAVAAEADRVTGQASQYYIANQQAAAAAAAQLASVQATLTGQAAQNAAVTALETARLGAAVALGQSSIERTVVADGSETRRLINELKYHDLNRMLVERNAELVDERYGRRHWRGVAEQNQFATLQNQVQAFGSQLQETRQGIVNLGTMAGVGQTSTNNNI